MKMTRLLQRVIFAHQTADDRCVIFGRSQITSRISFDNLECLFATH